VTAGATGAHNKTRPWPGDTTANRPSPLGRQAFTVERDRTNESRLGVWVE